ncbi:hypothetical protein F4804DRAFT_217550 [Jackrogersella minutella]|nr:hypothetical protein F4804DRAFT_217550 [Jackrogersella minutella]
MSPLPADHAAPSSPSAASHLARAIARVLAPRDDDSYAKCHPQPNIDLCEKPDAASNTSTIVIGTLGGLLAAATIITLVVLHLRRQRRDEREWPKNNQELEDYGIGPIYSSTATVPAPPRPKNAYRQPRVDPDDGGHLPPPGRRDSLKSLARSIRADPTAYRPKPDEVSHDMKPVEPTSQI